MTVNKTHQTSKCGNYLVFKYSSGLFGLLLKKEERIITVERQFHTPEEALKVGEEFVGIRNIVQELEAENCEQLSLF